MRAELVITAAFAVGCQEDPKAECREGFAEAADGACVPTTPGTIERVSLGPEPLLTQDTAQASVVLSTGPVEEGLPYADYPVRYRWFVDGVESSGTADHLHGWKYFEKGETLSVLVEPLEGGMGFWSNSVTVGNTPPPAPGVEVYPDLPYAGVDTLRCSVTGVGDFDGDSITYRIEWTRDGVAWSASPPPPSDDGGDPPDWDTGDLPPEPPPDPSEVPASVIQSGEQWTCHVSAFDGTDWSRTVTASVSIHGDFTGWDSSTFDLADSDYIFLGERPGDVAGASLSWVGDVDADGLGDFVVPAYFNDDSAEDAGKVYLVRGQDLDAGPGVYSLADMPFSFTGQTATEEAGHATGPAGDVDGDGRDDFLICGYRNDDPFTDVGRVYLITADSLAEPGVMSTADAAVTFIGEAENNRLGHAVGTAGDMDGDGLPELLMGAYGHAAMGLDSGKTYIVPGASLVMGEDVYVGTQQYMYLGEAEDDASGHALRGAGDVDGDGLQDVVVGARRNDTGAFDGGKGCVIWAGASGQWVLWGHSPMPTTRSMARWRRGGSAIRPRA